MPTYLHIVQRMAPGGIETIVLDLARTDAEVLVISLEGTRDDLVRQWPALGVLDQRLMTLAKGAGLQWSLIPRLAALMRRNDVTAIVSHHIGPLVYGGLASRLAGVKRRIHVEHDGWHYAAARRRWLAKGLEWLVAPSRVAVSHATARQVAEALGTVRQTIIANGVDLNRFVPAEQPDARRRFGLPAQSRLIGCVGRLETVKGQDVLIEALARLPSDWHLVLAGQGSEEGALRRLSAVKWVADRVHFLGHVEATEALFPAFDLLALPSRAEGFPRVLIEAQASGIPVVAADVGGVAEAVCPATGLLVPAGDPAALAAGIAQLAAEPAGLSPRAFVDPRFSNRQMAAQYRALLAA